MINKHRGKTHEGKWVYGECINKRIAVVDDFNEDEYFESWLDTYSFYQVIPETVGRYIGGKGYTGNYYGRHNNMVDLYEGDIVEAMSEGSKGVFSIWYRQEGNPAWILYPNWQSKKHWSISFSNIGNNSKIKGDCFYDDLKLIGNIHDNTELLKAI